MLEINRKIAIPLRELQFTFARSSGPGGQNVNKVNTKVTMHWAVRSTPSLPEDVRERFCKKYSRRINNDGQVVIHSQRYRDQGRNVADCLAKLRGLILEVSTPPKRRKATRPSRASKERRIRQKKQQSQKKQMRGRPRRDD